MSRVLYEWEFVNYICRVVESEPGIVHFEQARKESDGDPRVMEFQHTATPMGAANEIIQLHRALAEAKMLNRDLAAFYQGYQEDRNRREQRIAQLEADLEAAMEALGTLYEWANSQEWEHEEEQITNYVSREMAIDAGDREMEGTPIYEKVRCPFSLLSTDPWMDLLDNNPAVRAAWEGKS